jgi:hypothetical protein
MQAASIRYWDDVILLFALVVSALSGLYQFFLLPRGITLGIPPPVLFTIHMYAGIVLVLAVLVHLYFHLPVLWRLTKQRYRK